MKLRKNNSKKVFLIFLLILLYCIFLRLCYCLLKMGSMFPEATLWENLFSHLINVVPMMIMTAFNVLIIFTLTRRLPLARYLWAKILTDFVVTFVLMYGAYAFFIAVYRATFKPELQPDISGIFVYYITTFLVVEMLYYIKHSRDAIKKAEYAKREALQYQYDALKAQVNPHFLFNSLNVLLAVIDTDTRKASEFTIALSHIYRYILATQNRTSVLLQEELQFLDSYVHILQMKYDNCFDLEVVGQIDTDKKSIIPFTLQLLVENITKHNTISDKYPMYVRIVIRDDHMTVTNRIKRKKSSSNTGVGLRYITSQYKANARQFEVENDGEFFTAKIPFL